MKVSRSLILPVLFVLLLSLWKTLPLWERIHREWNLPPHPTWVVPPGKTIMEARADPDTILIHSGLLKAPRFQDTFRWWTGTWAGQVPFYRPLPSLLFWCEWKRYGDYENRYAIFPLLFYFLALCGFLCLSVTLFVYVRLSFPAFATLICGLIFTNGLGMFPLRDSANGMVMDAWKNQPDSLCALFFFLSFTAYLRLLLLPESFAKEGQKTQTKTEEENSLSPLQFLFRRFARPSLLWTALALYLASCASKEAGVILPLLLIALEAPSLLSRQRERVSAAVRRLTPFLIALPIFLLYRAWCLGTMVGFQYGSNGSWGWRVLSSAFGPVSTFAVNRQWATVALSGVLTVIFLKAPALLKNRNVKTKRPLWHSLALLGGVIAGLIALNLSSFDPEQSFIERIVPAFLMYFIGGSLQNAFVGAIFAVGAITGLRKCPLLALFGYGWVLLELVLLSLSPSPPHRYYLLEGGYALWIGGGLTIFAGQFAPLRQTTARADKTNSSPSPPAPLPAAH